MLGAVHAKAWASKTWNKNFPIPRFCNTIKLRETLQASNTASLWRQSVCTPGKLGKTVTHTLQGYGKNLEDKGVNSQPSFSQRRSSVHRLNNGAVWRVSRS